MAEPPTCLQNIARIRGDLSLASTLSFPGVVVDAENRLGVQAKHAHLPMPERAAACVFDLRRARSMFEDCGYAVAHLSFADMCAKAMSDFAAPDLRRCLESYYGNARREKLMLQDMLGGGPRRFAILWEGLTMAGAVGPDGTVSGVHSQDTIHNAKKMLNPLDQTSRLLQMGPHQATWEVIIFGK